MQHTNKAQGFTLLELIIVSICVVIMITLLLMLRGWLG